NNDRALIVGSTTFGKGTVQSIYELPLEAAIKITVGQYYTPGDRSIQSVGITPDIELLPVKVHPDQLDTIENILTFEKDLEKHLAREALTLEQPTHRLRFLDTVTATEEETQEYKTRLDLEGDTAASLALELMDVLTSGSRPAMLKEAAPLLAQKQKSEESRMTAAFEKLGVDWQEGKPEGSPQAQLSYDLLKNGKKTGRALAGEEITLRIQVKNVGDGPFWRLAAQTDSEIFTFKNFEFAFGKVAPRETKSWEHTLKIPKVHPAEEAGLNLQFKEGYGHAPPPVEILLPVAGLPSPRFAHQFSLEPGAFEKLGGGAAVHLEVTVANEGEGTSAQPVVAIKNLGGREVFIEKGREVLKELRPGKKETARFRFHLDPEATAGELRFELSITDADLFVQSTQEIVLRLAEQKTEPAAGQWFHPPTITLARKTGQVASESYSLQGEARDDQNIRDVYIFVGDEKTFYEANAGASPELKFKAPLTLKQGNNMILITARDNQNLTATHRQVIRFEPEIVQKGAL
ncbi:MAG: hypothetical protein HY609_00590, partial [Deltaproteobacteria bacterium]|nr:hypothetical protein [Deltaproteobacteria bacterium]